MQRYKKVLKTQRKLRFFFDFERKNNYIFDYYDNIIIILLHNI